MEEKHVVKKNSSLVLRKQGSWLILSEVLPSGNPTCRIKREERTKSYQDVALWVVRCSGLRTQCNMSIFHWFNLLTWWKLQPRNNVGVLPRIFCVQRTREEKWRTGNNWQLLDCMLDTFCNRGWAPKKVSRNLIRCNFSRYFSFFPAASLTML